MLLIHDLSEIETGDTYRHDVDYDERTAMEPANLLKVLQQLPAPQREELADLCREFEYGDSPEAQFARALRGPTAAAELRGRRADVPREQRDRG